MTYDHPEIELIENFLGESESDVLFAALIYQIKWQQFHVKLFGQRRASPRLSAWYGDPGAIYTYSGSTNQPQHWILPLTKLRHKLERQTDNKYNSVLANLYRSGDDNMGWHSDDEKALGESPVIAAISLGASRKFQFSHRQNHSKQLYTLHHGSLLIMKGSAQKLWRHRIPKQKISAVDATTKFNGRRINLTYRYIFPS